MKQDVKNLCVRTWLEIRRYVRKDVDEVQSENVKAKSSWKKKGQQFVVGLGSTIPWVRTRDINAATTPPIALALMTSTCRRSGPYRYRGFESAGVGEAQGFIKCSRRGEREEDRRTGVCR